MEAVDIFNSNSLISELDLGVFDKPVMVLLADSIEYFDMMVLLIFLFFPETFDILIAAVSL